MVILRHVTSIATLVAKVFVRSDGVPVEVSDSPKDGLKGGGLSAIGGNASMGMGATDYLPRQTLPAGQRDPVLLGYGG
jgi:hypothetical protein